MIPVIERYRKQLVRHLCCCKDTQARLLDSFDKNMLSPLLEVSDHPSEEELHTAFGTPAEAAALLMEQVSEEETACYRRQRQIRQIVSAAILAIVLLFAGYVFFEKEFSQITQVEGWPTEITTYQINEE